MPAVLYILFGAGLTIAVSIAAGRLLLGRTKLPLDRAEHHVFSFLLGSALLSLIVFLLCTAGLARKGVFLAVGVLLLVAGYRSRPVLAPSLMRLSAIWKLLLLSVGGAYFLLYFFNALAPEISPDGSTYHLGLVARYLREHAFHRITNDMYASYSQGIEMLFLFAFAFGRHSAAAMVHFSYLLALAAMVVLYARRAGMAPAGVCAALIVFASPIFGVDGTSAYNDVATACIAFGVFYLLQIWDVERTAALAIPIGLLAGFAYAAKFTLAVAIPYALGFVVWRSWRSRRPFLKPAITIAVCALLMMVPWMAKNWLWVHNPFSPFLNSVFPNPYIQVGFEQEYGYHMRHYEGIRSNAELPWLVTVDGRLSGFLGPLFLLAPLGLLGARPARGSPGAAGGGRLRQHVLHELRRAISDAGGSVPGARHGDGVHAQASCRRGRCAAARRGVLACGNASLLQRRLLASARNPLPCRAPPGAGGPLSWRAPGQLPHGAADRAYGATRQQSSELHASAPTPIRHARFWWSISPPKTKCWARSCGRRSSRPTCRIACWNSAFRASRCALFVSCRPPARARSSGASQISVWFRPRPSGGFMRTRIHGSFPWRSTASL